MPNTRLLSLSDPQVSRRDALVHGRLDGLLHLWSDGMRFLNGSCGPTHHAIHSGRTSVDSRTPPCRCALQKGHHGCPGGHRCDSSHSGL